MSFADNEVSLVDNYFGYANTWRWKQRTREWPRERGVHENIQSRSEDR